MAWNSLSIAWAVTAILTAAAALPNFAAEGDQAKEQAAVAAAEAWLKLVDEGKIAESHQQSSEYFRNAVTEDQWKQAVTAVRKPIGKLVSRKLKSATAATMLPGAPDGQYMVIQFDASFENKATAVETVTPMLEKDGKWRVTGYFIK